MSTSFKRDRDRDSDSEDTVSSKRQRLAPSSESSSHVEVAPSSESSSHVEAAPTNDEGVPESSSHVEAAPTVPESSSHVEAAPSNDEDDEDDETSADGASTDETDATNDLSELLDIAQKNMNEGQWLRLCTLLKATHERLQYFPQKPAEVLQDGSLRTFCKTVVSCLSSLKVLGGGEYHKRRGIKTFKFTVLSFDVSKYGYCFSELMLQCEGKTLRFKPNEFKSWLIFHLKCQGVIRMTLKDKDRGVSMTLIDFDTARHWKASTHLSSAHYNAAEAQDTNFFGFDTMSRLHSYCVCVSDEDCSSCTLHPNKIRMESDDFWKLCFDRLKDYMKSLVPESHQHHYN